MEPGMKFAEDMLRLYAVTDRSWTGRQTLTQQVEAALRGGATCVQLREKEMERDALVALARELKALCARYGVPLLINDDAALALEVDADGVHVGQEDMAAQEARRLIGPDRILGVTAKTVEQALAAQAAGADYLGSGAIFGSATKRNARPMSRELLQSICKSVSIPVVAIGGISRENIASLADTGIRGAAIVSGIFAAPDIEAECRLLRSQVERIIL